MSPHANQAKENEHPDGGLHSGSDAGEAPPSYEPVGAAANGDGKAANHGADTNVTAAFTNLSISSFDRRQVPAQDTCMAHLKLLHAIQGMKEDIGYTDGLWGIWDSQANNDTALFADDEGTEPAAALSPDEKRKKALSRLREKRWALFVARAVDRYTAWWDTQPKRMLIETDMVDKDTSRYQHFPTRGKPMKWPASQLPPLDVLMVMHTHMLNPRDFLEDTLRHGLISYWTAGLPWQTISDAIDARLTYNVPEQAKVNWIQQTGRNWDNAEDTITKEMKCPYCSTINCVPWTTCGTAEKVSEKGSSPGLIGTGYGDGGFQFECHSCRNEVTKDTLSVAKFVKDVTLLLGKSIPMPGTILDNPTGTPLPFPPEMPPNVVPQRFPNLMIKLELRSKALELLTPPTEGTQPPTMDTVREMVEKVVQDDKALRRIANSISHRGGHKMSSRTRVAVRKMMGRYWDNSSPFALDLCGAVMRQGVFVEKMVKIDWLHSPSVSSTMLRSVVKYLRFLDIMKSRPLHIAVPTLDVDLAWHTHQLTPSAYYYYTVRNIRKFIDHDDKMDENKLSTAFEWTCGIYQQLYHEVYSECTCWYCETIRASHVSSVRKLFGKSENEKISDAFYSSGAANLCPPDNSAHISTHNAVRVQETKALARVNQARRAREKQRLDDNYEKAVKRARKKGREVPPRDDYYSHWGYMYPYYAYAPIMFPVYTGGFYGGGDPGTIHCGDGAWANCAAGTCAAGGGVAAGACGGPGGCGSAGGLTVSSVEEAVAAAAAAAAAAAVAGEEAEEADVEAAAEQAAAVNGQS